MRNAVSDNMTGTLGRKYNNINIAVNNSCKRNKKQWIETKCQEAEHAATKIVARPFYKIARDLPGSSSKTPIPIKNKARTILLLEDEQNSRWVEHFSKVLN